MLSRRWFLLVFLCGNALTANAEVSFSRDVLPLLKSRCVMCHLSGSAQAGLVLHPNGYANLVGVKATQSPLNRIAPGDPENSYLYRKLAGTQLTAGGEGERMPFGETPLTDAQLDLFRRWIAEGAQRN